MPRSLALQFAFALALLSVSPSMAADPDPPPDATVPPAGVTGDWGGLRTRLQNDGLTFNGGYVSELAYNASGGARQAGAEAGQIDLGVTADLGRLAGVPGGVFQA